MPHLARVCPEYRSVSGKVDAMARLVPAVSRAFDILELLIDQPVLSAPEIATRLGLPRSTVHELIGTLVERSYLVPVTGQPTRFRLGLKVFQLGSAFAERLDLVEEAGEAARTVSGECDETVQVAILDGSDVVYIAKVDSTHPVRMVSAVGRRLPAHCTALGKMLLSGLRPEAFEARYPRDRPLARMTPRSITSVVRLRAHLEEVGEAGLAYDHCESNEAVHCVAAPVLDHTGEMVAAMSVSVPTMRWSDERGRELGELVRAGAQVLSRRLGYPS